jgi:hypothetical protein
MLSLHQAPSAVRKALPALTWIKRSDRLGARQFHGVQRGTAQGSAPKGEGEYRSGLSDMSPDLSGNPVVRDALVPIVIEQTVSFPSR